MAKYLDMIGLARYHDGIKTMLNNFADYFTKRLSNLENSKVSKVQGKDLSTNDFTDNHKLKLESLRNKQLIRLTLINGKVEHVISSNSEETDIVFSEIKSIGNIEKYFQPSKREVLCVKNCSIRLCETLENCYPACVHYLSITYDGQEVRHPISSSHGSDNQLISGFFCSKTFIPIYAGSSLKIIYKNLRNSSRGLGYTRINELNIDIDGELNDSDNSIEVLL